NHLPVQGLLRLQRVRIDKNRRQADGGLQAGHPIGLHRQNVGPSCQGANSSSPTPASSLLVFSPLATAMIFSNRRPPTSSTVSNPSRMVPELMSMSSSIHW